MRMRKLLAATALASAWLWGSSNGQAMAQSTLSYSLIGSQFVAGDGGYDYLTFDAGRDRLYVTRTGGVDVFHAAGKTLQLVGTLPGMPSIGVNRAVLVTEHGIGFTSNGAGDSTTIFSLDDLHVWGIFPLGQSSDAAVFDSRDADAVFFSKDQDNALIYDLVDHRIRGKIPLGSAPEFAVADRQGHVYVNLPDTGKVAKLDIERRSIVSEHGVDPSCQGNSSLDLDIADHLLFAGCANGQLVVMNADTGATIGSFAIGLFIDGVIYDPSIRTAFAASVDGKLAAVRVLSSSEVRLLGTVPTAAGARTITADFRNHHVFTDYAEQGPPQTPGGFPSSLPDTFHILTFAPSGDEADR